MSDIAVTSQGSDVCWKETMAKRKLTKAEHEEREREHTRILANAERTRRLAERAQAKLDTAKDSRG